MALILKNSARDFISGLRMDWAMYKSEEFDIHHIFPKKHCERRLYKKVKFDCVINKTPITAKTNKIIGSKAPKEYLSEIINKYQVNRPNLKSYLAAHWIDIKLLMDEEFDEFIAARAGLLLDAVEKVTGKKILGRDSDEVKNFFGRTI